MTSPWRSVGVVAKRLRLSTRNVQLYIRAGALQALAVEAPRHRVFFAIHELELRRFGNWLLTRRERRPAAVRKGGQLQLPLSAVVKPMPWTLATFKPRMARAELTRAYREATRERRTA
jgi:hypothetical protein